MNSRPFLPVNFLRSTKHRGAGESFAWDFWGCVGVLVMCIAPMFYGLVMVP